jgi:hypothetical protein
MCIDKNGLACYLLHYEYLSFSSGVGVQICTVLLPVGSKGRYVKNFPTPADQSEARKPGHINCEKYTYCTVTSLEQIKI